MKEYKLHNLRLFDTHTLRKCILLNGVWDFSTPQGFRSECNVPSVWESFPALSSYRGKATYEREVDVEEDSFLRFYFEGVSFFAKVFFDGKPIGKHYNGYTPFSVTTDFVRKGKHRLKVEVSNKYGFRSALHVPNDYYSYGGITRGVQMEYVGAEYIESVGLISRKKGDLFDLTVRVSTKNLSAEKRPRAVSCLFCGKEYPLGKMQSGTVKEFTLRDLKVDLWSPENPILYPVTVFLHGEKKDDMTERTGFREINCDQNGIYVNGQKTYLFGVNRHENGGKYGASVPFSLLCKDMELIEELGANFIRTCHYPNDSLFLDLCDEEGILVWEETHARGLALHQMMNPYFLSQVNACGKEMTERHISHPSVIITGCLNECADFTLLGKYFYKKHVRCLRKLDSSRPVTFASCSPFRTKTLESEDIVSYNCYFGWTNKEKIEIGYPKMLAWLKEQKGARGKPLLISEFGAGGIFARHGDADYTEESQSALLENNIRYYLSRPEIAGIAIWQFADVRVDPIWFPKRPGGVAREGLVDEERNKKKSFDTVKKLFSEQKEKNRAKN